MTLPVLGSAVKPKYYQRGGMAVRSFFGLSRARFAVPTPQDAFGAFRPIPSIHICLVDDHDSFHVYATFMSCL